MAVYKCTAFFFYEEQGFSETFYKTADSNAQAMEAFNTHFVPVRKHVLGGNYYLTHTRACNVDSPRDAAFTTYGDASARGQARMPNHNLMTSEQSMDAWNVRLFAGVSSWRSYLIRGLGGSAFDSNGRPRFNGAYYDKMNDLMTEIKDGAFQILKGGIGASQSLTSVVRADSKIGALVTAAPVVGAVAGATVKVYGAQGISNINTLYKVLEVLPGNTYRVRPRQCKNLGDLTENSGRVATVTYTPSVITNWSFIGTTSRRAGRPSYVPRGRRSVKKS